MTETPFELRSAADGRELKLAMQSLWLTGQILPMGARLLVRHTFRSDEDDNLEVIYAFMLPREATLRKFTIDGPGFEAHSELKRVQEAIEVYEQGIAGGHLSTLSRSYRDGVVNLTVGNLKKGDEVAVTIEVLAGVELHDDGLRFRFPFSLAPGYHAQMRAASVDGLGEMELPADQFGDVILPRYKADASRLHEVGFDLSVRFPGAIVEIGSPSHMIRIREDNGVRRVGLSTVSDVPNRDLVLDVSTADKKVYALGSGGHCAVVAPSAVFGNAPAAPRTIAMVIDRSGSMNGMAIQQARKAAEACLSALSPDDRFAIIAFDNEVETFRPDLAKPGTETRREAKQFLDRIDARGGTELAAGFAAGARLAAGGDVLVLTDGQVMGTEDILAQARSLNVRIHCLGIGAASQDRFLAQLATSTGGVSRFVSPRERVDVAVIDVFASIGRPVASGVALSGMRCALKPADTVFAGTPWVAFGDANDGDDLRVDWKGGSLRQKIGAAPAETADTIALLEGARLIADLESRMVIGTDKEMTEILAGLSLKYNLTSQAMALVAVVTRKDDVAGALPSTRIVPVGMPAGTHFDAYFAPQQAMAAPAGVPMAVYAAVPVTGSLSLPRSRARMIASSAPATKSIGDRIREAASRYFPPAPTQSETKRSGDALGFDIQVLGGSAATEPEAGETDTTDRLVDLATSLGPDGGAAGDNPDERALKTISALLLFLSEGHTPTNGAFRAHVQRMVSFLDKLTGLDVDKKAIVDRVIEFARAGRLPRSAEASTWREVGNAVA